MCKYSLHIIEVIICKINIVYTCYKNRCQKVLTFYWDSLYTPFYDFLQQDQGVSEFDSIALYKKNDLLHLTHHYFKKNQKGENTCISHPKSLKVDSNKNNNNNNNSSYINNNNNINSNSNNKDNNVSSNLFPFLIFVNTI